MIKNIEIVAKKNNIGIITTHDNQVLGFFTFLAGLVHCVPCFRERRRRHTTAIAAKARNT